ncbi:hypothetical protein Daus18300_001182 [Diaporthe australafricana]|uniref:HNH domain-containing protein n=1 Tax=Diaporthe australafricana TaxID=127596 RepID=A0ABR3Y0P4_9PEZI
MPLLPQMPTIPQDVEVIDLTGLSDDEDGDEWEDVIDLTNLPSDDDKNNNEPDRAPRQYTILDLPPRPHYTLVDNRSRAGQNRTRRASRAPSTHAPIRHASVVRRVPVRRDVCELCARVVRWGPGVLITKHHLYPQQMTKKYPEKFTDAQRTSIALLCRPCHDACHRAHSNRTLADYYYEVNLLRADPNVHAHVRSMQRASTPELIMRYGDGVHVRRRKDRVRAARSVPPHMVRSLRSRRVEVPLMYTNRVWRKPQMPTSPHPVSVRRSARLLAKGIGQPLVPIIVIDDDDAQDVVMREGSNEEEHGSVRDIVSREELAALEARGEYIPL